MPTTKDRPITTRNQRLEVKLPPELLSQVREAARQRGFTSANAFVRAAIANELKTGESALERTEQTIAASLNRAMKELRSLHTASQANFAITDGLVRLFLSCIPEPDTRSRDAVRKQAKLRYRRFIQSVAKNMTARNAIRMGGAEETDEG